MRSIKPSWPSDMKQSSKHLSMVNHPISLLSDECVEMSPSLHKACLHKTLWTCINVLSKHLPFWIQASVCDSHTLCKETPQSVMVVIVLVTALQDYINRADRMGGDVVVLLFPTVISVFTSFISGDTQTLLRKHWLAAILENLLSLSSHGWHDLVTRKPVREAQAELLRCSQDALDILGRYQ